MGVVIVEGSLSRCVEFVVPAVDALVIFSEDWEFTVEASHVVDSSQKSG